MGTTYIPRFRFLRGESEEKQRELEREGELLTLGRLGGEGAWERVREWVGLLPIER